ncbi:hypothetical protein CPC16_000340 [Podila verticillata]|nr:hypothetical protein BGZ52_003289 [Haplosporangium bisporale]KAF9210946.1 hypothetical protein BGZ59_008732 [Podila verticillata]KAF9376134.1 hypothetical protein CPC16_000340 [Podila verticillata]KFH73526.1 hypothetical protein MVEG_00742 [Podila verticillata NRRL 6337]
MEHQHYYTPGHPSDQPVKGILKKPAATQPTEQAPRLKWDEENLIITEAQKDSTMKIDEPKTPYVHYNHELDRVMDMDEVFALDGPKKKHAALAHTPPVPSYFKGLPDEDEDEDEDDDRDRDEEPEEWQDSDEEDEQDEHKKVDHDKFAKMRAEHYKMKEAIHLGHQLVEEEEDEDDESSSKVIPPVPVIPASISSNLKKYGAPGGNVGATRVKDDDEESLDMEL